MKVAVDALKTTSKITIQTEEAARYLLAIKLLIN